MREPSISVPTAALEELEEFMCKVLLVGEDGFAPDTDSYVGAD